MAAPQTSSGPGSVALLSQSDVRRLLTMPDCIAAVEQAFRFYGEGKTTKPGVLGVHTDGGGFHIKAGILGEDKPYFVAKVNGNYPGNPQRGLPTIQGVLYLADARNGVPLALMDSAEITNLRTGAATGIAAKYLARKDSSTALLIGSGVQARPQLLALAAVLPLKKVFAYSIDAAQAQAFAQRMSAELGIDVAPVEDFRSVIGQCDVCVTCTTARQWFLGTTDIPLGTFIAAVGADNEHKQELQPELLAKAKVVTDITDQCAVMGDLHHAIAAGLLTRGHVHAELGEIVAGYTPGRTSGEEIIIFDSTGMALQDVAAAVAVYEAAVRHGGLPNFQLT